MMDASYVKVLHILKVALVVLGVQLKLFCRFTQQQSLNDKPWQWIVFISAPPVSSNPSSLSNDIPDEVMLKGKARGGDIGDFATLINLWPAREKKIKNFKHEIKEVKTIVFTCYQTLYKRKFRQPSSQQIEVSWRTFRNLQSWNSNWFLIPTMNRIIQIKRYKHWSFLVFSDKSLSLLQKERWRGGKTPYMHQISKKLKPNL